MLRALFTATQTVLAVKKIVLLSCLFRMALILVMLQGLVDSKAVTSCPLTASRTAAPANTKQQLFPLPIKTLPLVA